MLALRASADHEAAFYPSYYPQEIRLDAIGAASVAAGWSKARVHGYLGDDLFAAEPPPADAFAVESLRSLVVLTFDGAGAERKSARDPAARCAEVQRLLQMLPPRAGDYVRYAYPVTPFHADYLQQFDLAQRTQARNDAILQAHPGEQRLRIRAIGPLAGKLLPPGWQSGDADWDATLEEIPVDRLAAGSGLAPGPGGWLGAPWAKQGWFQAYALYTHRAPSPAADAAYRRLTKGAYRNPTERIRLERALVTNLTASCTRAVVGYTLRRQYVNNEYSVGIENIGFDSQSGLEGAIFPRTVKLKDFPWNGWLRLGMASPPAAAWNPIGGFNDEFGRVLWQIAGDQALLPEPYGGSWIADRVRIDPKRSAAIRSMPADVVRPHAGSGMLRPVGARAVARQRLRYSAVTSLFHDGTQTTYADLIYPYIFAARWSDAASRGAAFDPDVARSAVPVVARLAGFKLLRVTTETRNFGDDMQFRYQVPVIDVYLNDFSDDPWQAAALAPPWSTMPWELIVLMEEAVERGIAAFSAAESKRRGVPWLDLARDGATGAKLAALVERFHSEGYRPAALESLVTEDQARERWMALGAFYARHGHFLDSNGPYRLESWSPAGAVLQVFRDPSYPGGVGSLDRFAVPLRAYARSIEDHGDRLEIIADADRVSRSQRSYEVVRGPLAAARGEEGDVLPECRYVIVAPNGDVASAGGGSVDVDGRYALSLGSLSAPGVYKVIIALYIGGNSMNPEVRIVEHRVSSHRSGRPDR